MSVIRRSNFLGQQRLDVAHLRQMESAVSGDFDVLAGKIISGNESYVVKGFTIAVAGVGGAASSLEMTTAGGVMLHPLASESGTIFFVPSDQDVEVLSSITNPKVSGSFTSNAINFVGIDLRRTADDSTSDLVAFIDADTEEEFLEEVPLARILDYKIVISTTPFSATPALCPVAIVSTDAANAVTSISDARPMMYRLGSGGTTPDNQASFTWPFGREENITGDIFVGGDKELNSQKSWQDAVMTRLWEIGGGKYWYSSTADRNVQLIRNQDTGPFTNSDWFEWDGTHLHWQGLSLVFENSGGGTYVNYITDQTSDEVGLTDLDLDEGCIYVDINRSDNATIYAVKGLLSTLGEPEIPGTRFILAYCIDETVFARGAQFPIGQTFTAATTSALGIVSLSHAEASAGDSPIVYSIGAANVANGVVALDGNKRASYTSTTGNAFIAISGGGGGIGVQGTGNGSGSGGEFTGGATGNGVAGTGNGSAEGGIFVGGASDGPGVRGLGNGNGDGVQGVAGGSGTGGVFDGGGTAGIGVIANPGSVNAGGTDQNQAISASGNIYLSGTVPGSSVSFQNTLTPRNVVKAWGVIAITGDGGGGQSAAIETGFNLTGITATTSTTITVGLAGDLAVTEGSNPCNYLVMVNGYSDGAAGIHIFRATSTLAGSFVIQGRSMTPSAIGDSTFNTAEDFRIEFIVLGIQ